jgi:hypothetical protein
MATPVIQCNDKTTWNAQDLATYSVTGNDDITTCAQTAIKNKYPTCGDLENADPTSATDFLNNVAATCFTNPINPIPSGSDGSGNGGSSNTWIIILIVVLSLVVIGVGVGVFFATRK